MLYEIISIGIITIEYKKTWKINVLEPFSYY